MIDIYVSKGLSLRDATVVIKTMAKYENFFVDIMMQQELELQVPEDDHVEQSMKEGTNRFAWNITTLIMIVMVMIRRNSMIMYSDKSFPFWPNKGFVMFCSFAFFGSMPLLGYVIIPFLLPELESRVLFQAACVVTGLVLFFLGSIKSNFSRSNWFWSGLETLILGGLCATVAFSIGSLVNGLVGENDWKEKVEMCYHFLSFKIILLHLQNSIGS